MRNKFSSAKYSGVIAAMILANGAPPAFAGDVVAARNIRAGAIIAAEDVSAPDTPGALRQAAGFIGLEAARSIYKGQIIAQADLRPPTLVARNAVVTMEFVQGPLTIETEGRALDQGGSGERIRVMNLLSKRIVTAVVIDAATVRTKQ